MKQTDTSGEGEGNNLLFVFYAVSAWVADLMMKNWGPAFSTKFIDIK